MMYLLVSAVVLAVLALEGQAQHVPCCLPERWTGALHQSLRFARRDSPTYGYRSAYMEYAYDYPNRRLAARIHNEYPNSYERFVLNFNQDRAYFIREDGCRYRDFRAREFSRACISESASYQGEFFMGLNQVTFYRWYVFNEHVHAIVDVTSDNCVPGFSRDHFENDLYSTHIDRIYGNITTDLTDESIFEEPTDCTEAPNLNFFDTSDEGITRMHAFHAIPSVLSTPQKRPHKKPMGF